VCPIHDLSKSVAYGRARVFAAVLPYIQRLGSFWIKENIIFWKTRVLGVCTALYQDTQKLLRIIKRVPKYSI
jgi:hypothetical protein